jgi:hypothetical protein
MDTKNYEYFMEADLHGFVGEWIAIVDRRVVSHGRDVRVVFKEAKKKCPDKKPFMARVPGEETMIL